MAPRGNDVMNTFLFVDHMRYSSGRIWRATLGAYTSKFDSLLGYRSVIASDWRQIERRCPSADNAFLHRAKGRPVPRSFDLLST